MTADDQAERLLREIAARARGGSFDVVDWKRFYCFVIVAATSRKGWSASDVASSLLQLGVPEEQSENLGDIYGHCRAVLYLHGKGPHRSERWSSFLG